jgi:hypothetical protein
VVASARLQPVRLCKVPKCVFMNVDVIC